MRVAHIVPVFPPYGGGMGTVAFYEAQLIAAAGVDVTVFTPRTGISPTPATGVRVVPLRPLLATGNAACLPAVMRHVGGYDLIHLHYPFFGTAELLAARRFLAGPRLILQYQMDVIGRGWLAHIFRWHRRLVLPLIVRAADAIIVTSSDYAGSSFLAPRMEALRPRLAVIPAGVDLGRFSPAGEADGMVRQFAAGRPVIFFLAGLDQAHYFKGLHVLLQALTVLPNVVLAVGGDGDLRPGYEAQAARLGVSERVRFVGKITDAALPAHYRAANVVALPSIDRTEAFGLVLLEAMACGRPVVASRLPGVRTLVEEGRNGYLAEPGNAADLADKIACCIRDESQLGPYARRWVEDRFGWEAIATRLLALYQSVLA
jgi:glycosyltransferase involved in cell wall biosynthesis